MHLHRVTPDPFNTDGKFLGKSSDEFSLTELKFGAEPAFQVVAAFFRRFGGGERRQSDYEVYCEWSDVERMIDLFCEAGNSNAIAMREGRKIVEVIQGLPRPPQSN